MSHLGSYDGKRVLVTGGARSIGTNPVRALAQAGARMVVAAARGSAA